MKWFVHCSALLPGDKLSDFASAVAHQGRRDFETRSGGQIQLTGLASGNVVSGQRVYPFAAFWEVGNEAGAERPALTGHVVQVAGMDAA